MRYTLIVLAVFLFLGTSISAAEPFKLGEALGVPEQFRLWGEARARYQYFDNQFRPGQLNFDNVILTRGLLGLEYRPTKKLRMGIEIADSRAYLDDESTRVFTGIINPLDLLQAYVEIDFQSSFLNGDKSSLKLGRMTHDQGRRRFVVRNVFRNTINAFTGALYRWKSPNKKHDIEAFYYLPVRRKPTSRQQLLDNVLVIDKEGFDVQYWGLFYKTTALPLGLTANAYIYGLHERDGAFTSRNRHLITPGFALYHISKPGEFYLDIEANYQGGRSRSTAAPNDLTELDHDAAHLHAEFGYHFDMPWTPRLLLQYDLATGDEDPTDTKNGRFDTLFGQRRGDFGHTDIYGAFARANIEAIAVATHLFPSNNIEMRLRYQSGFLHQRRDAWVPIGVRDASGQSGDFIGHQIETRFQWKIIPGSVIVESGTGFLLNGEFAENAPNANGAGNAYYFYSGVTLKF